MTDTVKQCRKCGDWKPVADFTPYNKTGHRKPSCKPCEAKRIREYYRENPDKYALRLSYSRDKRKLDVAKSILQRTRGRAKRRGIPFAISIDDLIPLPLICPVLGFSLNYLPETGYDPAAASLDRVDNSKGYVPGNIRIISLRANSIKSDATADELRAVADYCDGKERFPAGSPTAAYIRQIALALCA